MDGTVRHSAPLMGVPVPRDAPAGLSAAALGLVALLLACAALPSPAAPFAAVLLAAVLIGDVALGRRSKRRAGAWVARYLLAAHGLTLTEPLRVTNYAATGRATNADGQTHVVTAVWGRATSSADLMIIPLRG